jgi:hypothetical protein
MAETAYSTLLPQVLPWLPGCESGAAMAALRETGREFCRQTDVWRETLAVSAVAGTAAYALAYAGASVQRVLAVRLDGRALDERQYGFAPDGALTLATAPVANGALSVDVVLVPTVAATGLPDWLMARHGADIAGGAAARLKVQGNVPWSDEGGAGLGLRLFDLACATARREGWSGRESGDVRVQARRFV